MSVRVWGNPDQGTIEQVEKAGRLGILAGPVALMPDAHVGIGSTIGSVIPTEGAIIPGAVGVDIGCGMIGVRTSVIAEDLPDSMQPLVAYFEQSVPAGVGQGHDSNSERVRAMDWLASHPHELDGKLSSTALSQLGSLGSGNHFLEVCLDENDRVWVVLHSGSRGVGNQLATKHIKLARQQEQALEDPDLAYFLEGTEGFQSYVSDMLWAQEYARENREIMVDAALHDLFDYVGHGHEVSRVNCHHNFAQREFHGGKSIWITRKGAIEARRGMYGIIPGSMGTRSYIVEGLGEPSSYNSASHGAGRKMSRTQARKTLTAESLVEAMKGKAWNQDAQGLLDEHPRAYKDIDEVMEAQKDLVQIVHTLHQIVNYKASDKRVHR